MKLRDIKESISGMSPLNATALVVRMRDARRAQFRVRKTKVAKARDNKKKSSIDKALSGLSGEELINLMQGLAKLAGGKDD